ncbi:MULTISPECIES: NYN domain-containing protein [unclassified Desulfovibrio]|uniref:NYN domain-containing protein n=1 Tax=unclassified Desulfovibrio TaxID=2593640 RepID=UPI000F5FEB84|nr:MULTISPECIES: NYN domain-containing protein [unclassified Desulfovibrio]RRD69229.1 NYN domain-containing protein [Desulfovibrio sp. OH1209_COT-279]RRD85702.1 NYN domain-containing protein [Desulfovibrio sp. OH1186_COT-070]
MERENSAPEKAVTGRARKGDSRKPEKLPARLKHGKSRQKRQGKKGFCVAFFRGLPERGVRKFYLLKIWTGRCFFCIVVSTPSCWPAPQEPRLPAEPVFFQERSWIASFLLLMASTAIMPCWKAVTMLLEAARESFDKAFLFSGDSDMIAGVKALKNLAPHIHVKAIIPFGRSSIDLANNCHSQAKIKRSHLEKNQLPREIPLGGGKTLTKPQEWA